MSSSDLFKTTRLAGLSPLLLGALFGISSLAIVACSGGKSEQKADPVIAAEEGSGDETPKESATELSAANELNTDDGMQDSPKAGVQDKEVVSESSTKGDQETETGAAPVDEAKVDPSLSKDPDTAAADSSGDAKQIPEDDTSDDPKAATSTDTAEQKESTTKAPDKTVTTGSTGSKKVTRGRGGVSIVFPAPKKGTVTFLHRKHQNRKISCVTCHHQDKDVSKTPRSCRSCHGKIADAPPMMTAAHKRCRDCHKSNKKGPTKCPDCHVKAG